MEAITLNQLVSATGGELLGACRDSGITITGVSSDNRKIKAGDVFFAFKGVNSDGHRFVTAALNAGAAGAVISEEPEEFLPGKFYVRVPDTIQAVGDLAAFYRSLFSIPVIAVTGSVGKTTTKDMIASVLAQKFRVVKTQANFNNNIGLPRTLFTIDRSAQIAVIEMGMNHAGEISRLVHITQPDVVTITNIGEAHIGNLGSRENIFHAKCEIFEGLCRGGHAVLNGDDEYLVRLRGDQDKQERYTFDWVGEAKDCSFRAVQVDDTLQEGMAFTALTPQGRMDLIVPAPGRHMIYPVLTAAAIGARFGLSPEQIRQGVLAYVPTGMRMEAVPLPEGILLYNDAYNANPQSMMAGLRTLSGKTGSRHIAVLGDMLELGDREESLHRRVGAYAASLNIDTLVTVGKAAEFLADEAQKNGLRDVRVCRDREEAGKVIEELVQPGTVFLFKASHSMRFEELVSGTADFVRKRYSSGI